MHWPSTDASPYPFPTRIAVIGAGALGSTLCELLLEQRVDDVLIIDPGVLEARNLLCSQLFDTLRNRCEEEVIGSSKAELLASASRREGLAWRAVTEEVADTPLLDLADRNLLVTCPDNALARIEATFCAHILGMPLLDGAVMGEGIPSGRVTWFAASGPCYVCGLLEQRRADLLAYASAPSFGCRMPPEPGAMRASRTTLQQTASAMLQFILHPPCDSPSNNDPLIPGSSRALTSFARKLLLDAGCQPSEADEPALAANRILLAQSPTCPWHEPALGEWRSLPWERPIFESLGAGGLRVQLPWPYCTEALCRRCGSRSHPHRRLAWARRNALCAACGAAAHCEPVRVIESLSASDSAARFSPRQLGLPPRHLYLFRQPFTPASGKENDEPVA